MKYLLLVGTLVLVGCSGESAPEVGDAPITKGIQKRGPAPRTTSAAAASQPRRITPQEYMQMRRGQ